MTFRPASGCLGSPHLALGVARAWRGTSARRIVGARKLRLQVLAHDLRVPPTSTSSPLLASDAHEPFLERIHRVTLHVSPRFLAYQLACIAPSSRGARQVRASERAVKQRRNRAMYMISPAVRTSDPSPGPGASAAGVGRPGAKDSRCEHEHGACARVRTRMHACMRGRFVNTQVGVRQESGMLGSGRVRQVLSCAVCFRHQATR